MYREEAGVGDFDLDRPGTALDEPKRRSPSSRFGDLGDRLARTFSTSHRAEASWEPSGEDEHPGDVDSGSPWDQVVPRFAVTRQGYDCVAVDEHIAELERELVDLDGELAELRARTSSGGEVAAEIQRIGEQTSTILLAAHDEAQETTRRAQEQADRCLADAASNALAITEEANRKLRELEREKTFLARERSRMLEDIRSVAGALTSVADEAAGRFPPEPDSVSRPAAAVVNSAGDG
jgi:hypothetical protein